MAIASQYTGKCKDCGTQYGIGDMIDTNGNKSPNKAGEMKDHWCPQGKNCPGLKVARSAGSTTPLPGILTAEVHPTRTAEELRKKYFEIFPKDDHFGPEHWVQKGDNYARNVLGLYIGVLEACENMGITDPPVVGMILNNVVRRMQ